MQAEESKLERCLREIAADHFRWGHDILYRLLLRETFRVNHNRSAPALERGGALTP